MSAESHSGTVVVGVGNAALSDEAVAGRVISQVAKWAPAGVEVIDAGLPGPGILRFIEGRKRAIIVDAIDAGLPAGTVCRFGLDEVAPVDALLGLSLHQGNLLQHLRLAQTLGAAPNEIVIVGIQVEKLSPGYDLSPSVEKAVARAVNLVLAEVAGR